MMYSEKLCAAIKSNGKVLREHKDTVLMPFGHEYSIYIKNLNSVRALVNITIDGEDAAPGGLVLYGNQSVDFERFIKNGNLNEGNKFKFIERTANIEQHRGIGVEDGLIRIAYKFEEVTKWTSYTHWQNNTLLRGGIFGSAYNAGGLHAKGMTPSVSAELNSITTQGLAGDAGITVPGSHSDQKFQTAGWFATESTEHVMVIKLLGETPEGRKIFEPVTVKHKPKCETCGKQNRAHAKFCVECGTALEIYA